MKKLLLFMHLLYRAQERKELLVCAIDGETLFVGNQNHRYLFTSASAIPLKDFRVRSHMKIVFPNDHIGLISYLMGCDPYDANQAFSSAWFKSIVSVPDNNLVFDSEGEDSIFYGWDGKTWMMSGYSKQRPFTIKGAKK